MVEVKKADMHVHTSFSKEIIPGGINNHSKYAFVSDFVVLLLKIYRNLFRKGKNPIPIFDRNFNLMYRNGFMPEEIYNLAKEKKMDFVVFTDHDTIDGWIYFIRKYPDKTSEVICGEEVTTRFKEEPHEIHVGVYGLDRYSIDKALKIHEEIQENTDDVKKVIKIAKKYNLVVSLNHLGFCDFNVPYRMLTYKEIKRYLDNFEIIEVLNGDDSEGINKARYILSKRFDKKIIGGSDSHSTTVGNVYTAAEAKNKREFLDQIRKGNAYVCGKHGSVRKRIRTFLTTIKDDALIYYSDSYNKDFKIFIEKSMWKSLLMKALKPFIINTVKKIIGMVYFIENISADVIYSFLKQHPPSD